jgi:predicted transglutaminase-like cysteine proteinase
MRLITVTGLAAALALSATPAFAAKTSAKDQTVAQESGASAEAGEKKICKRLENSGTRMKNDRVCLTKAEWRKVEDQR